jgi:adenylate kinase family enzyme
MEELKKLFPKMSENDFLADARASKQEKIQEMMDGMDPNEDERDKLSIFKKPKIMTAEEKLANIDESQIPLINSSGFILMDFPNSYNQAKLLEQAFTNFITEDEKTPHVSQAKSAELRRLVKPSPKERQAKRLTKSGLDIIFNLDASHLQCFNRAFGKVNENSNKNHIYHFDNYPPPTDMTPLIEN